MGAIFRLRQAQPIQLRCEAISRARSSTTFFRACPVKTISLYPSHARPHGGIHVDACRATVGKQTERQAERCFDKLFTGKQDDIRLEQSRT